MLASLPFTIEKRRVLVPVGLPCPFGCKYCYTRGLEVGCSRLDAEEILAQFQHFSQSCEKPFDTIQLGYDGDPFSNPERGIQMLTELAKMGKHLNFSTKAILNDQIVRELEKIRERMIEQRTTLSALVSISCWDSAPRIEPHTPTPSERIQTIALLRKSGIPVFIALRPILPHVSDSEYIRIIVEGQRVQVNGFILGPLYADDRGQFVRFVPEPLLQKIPYRKEIVSWSAHTPRWKRYEDETRLQHLCQLVREHGGQVFLSSADAMKFVSQKTEEKDD